MSTQSHPPKHIVIIGGGFGGVRTALQLAKKSHLDITLISDRSEFAYYPQLYHAATGGARSESSIPLTELFAGHDVTLVIDKIATMNPDTQVVTGTSGTDYHYDELVLAMGSVTNFFGIKGLDQYAFNIKTIEGAEAFKRHLHNQIIEQGKTELDYVVVGAGPTGVELSAALGEYLGRIVRIHKVAHPEYHVDLVEATPRILPRSNERVAAHIEHRLRAKGIKIMTNTVVEGETAESLQLKGQQIATKTVVWTSGVANNPFFKENAALFTLAKNGRVEVNEFMEGREHVYVIGDNAAMPFGGQAETAINDANYITKDMMRKLSGRKRLAYRQVKPSSVIPVGSGWASAEYKGLEFFGFMGWILRRLGDLVGYIDIEPNMQAIKVWLKETRREDLCDICGATPKSPVPSR